MTSQRRNEVNKALDRHLTNGVIKDWYPSGPKNQHYTIILANGQAINTSNLRYIDMICLGLDSASQAWREALPGQGNSPAEAHEMGLGLAERLKRQARGDSEPGTWQAIAAEHGAAFREILGISPADIYERLMDWQRQGALKVVIATEPVGEAWVIIGTDAHGEDYMIKLGHDPDSATVEASAALFGLGQGALWGVQTALDRSGVRVPELKELFGKTG